MISFTDFDMMARGGSIALLVLWSWVLLRDHRQALPARMALGMNLTIVCHILASIPGPIGSADAEGGGDLFDFVLAMGSAAVPGFFWLFARTWFNDEARVGLPSWALISASVAIVAVQILFFEQNGIGQFLLVSAMRVSMFAFAIAGLWAAWRGRDGDLIEARRHLRTALVWSVGLFVMLVNGVEILAFRGVLPIISRSFIEIGILALTLAVAAVTTGLRQADLFAVQQRLLPPEPTQPVDLALVTRLETHMAHDRPYRDETLTIAGLAGQLGLQEYQLRRLINGALGHRNFASFLNGYRLDEVRAALVDAAQTDVPILTIALDAGFGSLGPFNRAFREAEGMTPSAFRRAALLSLNLKETVT